MNALKSFLATETNSYHAMRAIEKEFPRDEKFTSPWGEEIDGSDAWELVGQLNNSSHDREFFMLNAESRGRWIELDFAYNEVTRIAKIEREREILEAQDY